MSNRVTTAATFVPSLQQTSSLLLQRKCACGQHTVAGGQCGSCAKKDESLQRRAAGIQTTTEIPPIVHEVLNSPGQPLDTATRAFMEPRFHHDFSQVRIHADVRAAESARAVHASAYTVGSHVVFDAGQYVPGTKAGKNLLAHELTHVLQQTNGLTNSAPAGVGPANDEYERQADAVANAIVGVPGKAHPHDGPALIPGTYQTVAANDPPPPPPRTRLQRKTGDQEEELFDNDVFGGPTSQAGGGGSGSGTTTATCPKVPTGRGDEQPQPPCPTATHTGANELKRFNFCLDSDELTNPQQLNEVQSTVNSVHRSTRFLIHGYASPEGRKDYNFRLACHRAIKIANAFRQALARRLRSPRLDEAMLNAEVESRIETASQGPTSQFGALESNRVAVVFGQVPGRQAEEPGCENAPRNIGDIKPEFGCDVATRDLTRMNGGKHLRHFHFCLDSDVLAAVDPTDVRNFAHQQAASANFIVHGFSSVEGAADYNQRLSCHRALRIFRELINAGVKQDQITEVSGMGETSVFGDEPELNRVAVVSVEGGEIGDVPGGKRKAETRRQKEVVRDEAHARLMAGKYALGADAYISFWTCGRTPTVRAAIERLTIEVKDNNENEFLRDEANGTEEGFGVNFVRLSNVTLGADNAIECTMGRIIDMAFHHAVMEGTLPSPVPDPKALPGDLTGSRAARHAAGLHLVHLAGLGACTGRRATAGTGRGDIPVGIDAPLTRDPRAGLPPPLCAEAPQPTRLHPPAAGTKGRETPGFELVGTPTYTTARGKLATNFDSDDTKQAHLITTPDKGIITASATVQLTGQPDTFKDYEVGFTQTVIADEAQADYDSGHSVIQKLPVPIRLAEMKNKPTVPAPWTTSDAFKRPDAGGKVNVTSTGAGLNTESAIALRRVKATLPNSALHSFEQGTRIAIWLAARRLGAPLDRFSVRFLDGVTYDLTQLVHLEHRRIKGELEKPALPGTGERELPVFLGGFLASRPSLLPEDPASARLTGPIASEIGLFNQIHNIVEPEAATEQDKGPEEVKQVVQEILDNLVLFEDEEKARKGEGGVKMPRLGFDFIPLTITLPILRRTGRLVNPDTKELVVEVTGPGLGFDARQAIAEALEFRIRDLAFDGRDLKVRPSAIPGTGEVGNVIVRLNPLPRKPGADPSQESDLSKRSDVLDNMAEGWACTQFTARPDMIEVGAREFGRAYWMDRDKTLHPEPADRLVMGQEDMGQGFTTKMPCPRPKAGVVLGSFHTHPEVQIPPEPTEADLEYAKNCGAQHYIVTDNKAFRYFPDGRVDTTPINLPVSPGCHEVNLEEIKIVK